MHILILYIYIYIYIYVCVCVCVCARVVRLSFKHVWLNHKDTFCLHNFIKILNIKFPDKCLGFRLELVDEFTKIVLSAFRPFIGHHQGLFACIPVLETINIITNNIYHNPTLPPLKINSNTLQKILLLCSTTDPHGNIFIQKDGIAMGSVLGPIFSNFYMSDLENKVFNTINKPNIYLRYTDNIFLLTNSTNEINMIQETFQNNSVLNFTQRNQYQQ